jgi:hypothetical protein
MQLKNGTGRRINHIVGAPLDNIDEISSVTTVRPDSWDDDG